MNESDVWGDGSPGPMASDVGSFTRDERYLTLEANDPIELLELMGNTTLTLTYKQSQRFWFGKLRIRIHGYRLTVRHAPKGWKKRSRQ
jgi:hypothetical protein